MRPVLPVLSALSVLAPLALLSLSLSGAAQPLSSLTARSLEWQEADGTADLLALRLQGGDASFGLVAPSLHVRAVVADAYSRGPVGGAYVAPQWRTEESTLTDAALQLPAGRGGSFLYVLAQDASARVPCGAAEASDGTLQPPSQIEQPNPHPAVDLAQALALRPCGPIEVCGSFTLVLWERDAVGSSAEGPVELQSGQVARPGEPDARPALGGARQISLTADSGCLTMAAPGAEPPELFARAAALGSAPALLLHGARGELPGAAEPVDGALRVTGRLDAALARAAGAAVGVALAGEVESASVGGLPLQLGSAAAAQPAPRWSWLLSLATFLPAAAVGALWTRANRPEGLVRRAQRAAAEQEWGRVLLLTTKRLRRGDEARTRILRANALLALDEPAQALSQACLALLRLPDGPTKADAALVACRAASRLGRDQEALAWLGEVYAQDVRTAEHALRFPEVSRLTTAQDVSYS